MKSQPSGPIGLAPAEPKANNHPVGCADPETSADPPGAPMSKAAKKNQKRRERKKQQQGDDSSQPRGDHATASALANQMAAASLGASTKTNQVNVETNAKRGNSNSGAEALSEEKQAVQKKLRNLFKKLKAIDELQQKIDSGELKNPERTQLEKIARRADIVEQIEDLEMHFDD